MEFSEGIDDSRIGVDAAMGTNPEPAPTLERESPGDWQRQAQEEIAANTEPPEGTLQADEHEATREPEAAKLRVIHRTGLLWIPREITAAKASDEEPEDNARPESDDCGTPAMPTPQEPSPPLDSGKGGGKGLPPEDAPSAGGEDDGNENPDEPEAQAEQEAPDETQGEQQEVAARFNQFFKAVNDYNSHPEREGLAPIFTYVAKEASTLRELQEAGLTEEEARDSYAAVEGEKIKPDPMSQELLKVQMGEAYGQLGLGFSPDSFDHALPVIVDGERFTTALTEVDGQALSEEARASLEETLSTTANSIKRWTLGEQAPILTARYGEAIAETEGLELWEATIDPEAVRIIDQALGNVPAYGRRLQELGIGAQALSVLSAMSAAAQEGTLPEAALLHELGALYVSEEEFGQGYVGSWSDQPREWRLLDEIVNHVSFPGWSVGLCRHLAEQLPAKLDELHSEYEQVVVIPGYTEDEEYYPEETLEPDLEMAAFLAQKRDQYRRQLGG